MSPNSETRAETLFYEGIALPHSERDGFLDAACGADPSLRAEAEALLRAHDEAEGFLDVHTAGAADPDAEFGRLRPEQKGDRIDDYKLLERIGEGGFGTVWVADQERPVRRRVALKIIKPGMDTKEVIARFEQERQALAMMDHPNIAKVLGAGATPLGRPYFVMEWVRGVKITEHCDHANLSTNERLRIFIAVCQAVQHAHQKGVIHRDLKPSNILVTQHDGVPVPKVIDFGIAKATQQQRLTDLTIYTQFEQMVGTPLYMSPEQAEMSGLDIDTRSDIYSLGVLLYELLTGRTPFDPETLMKRGLEEIRRVVREQEPQKPSTFVSTMAADLRTNAAQQRRTDSDRLIGQIRGDLDWIVMKALEKDRSRRYDSAGSFAQDVERHLLDEPVQARPPTRLYRFRRFAKRNKVALSAASAVLAAVFAGLAMSAWMYAKERQARERAEAAELAQATERARVEKEAVKSSQVARFLQDMIEGVGPSVALGRDTVLLREILDKTAERVSEDLMDQPDVEAELRRIIGGVYFELGDYASAGDMQNQALALLRALEGDSNPDVPSSVNMMGLVRVRQGKLDEAEALLREALEGYRKLRGGDHSDVANALTNLGIVYRMREKYQEAETIQREALAMQRRLSGDDDPGVAVQLHNLATVLEHQGEFEEAEKLHRESLAILRTS